MSVVLDPSTALARQHVVDLSNGKGDGIVSIEYTRGESGGMSAQRWRDLSQPLPPDSSHALIIEVPLPNLSPSGVFIPASAGPRARPSRSYVGSISLPRGRVFASW